MPQARAQEGRANVCPSGVFNVRPSRVIPNQPSVATLGSNLRWSTLDDSREEVKPDALFDPSTPADTGESIAVADKGDDTQGGATGTTPTFLKNRRFPAAVSLLLRLLFVESCLEIPRNLIELTILIVDNHVIRVLCESLTNHQTLNKWRPTDVTIL